MTRNIVLNFITMNTIYSLNEICEYKRILYTPTVFGGGGVHLLINKIFFKELLVKNEYKFLPIWEVRIKF